MTEDIRSLLTSRTRSKVPPRDASLKSPDPSQTNPDAEMAGQLNHTSELDTEPSFREKDNNLSQNSTVSQKEQLEEELQKLPQIGKRLAIHLDQDIRRELLGLCDLEEITPETFIEASYALIQEKPKLMKQILKEAKIRLRQRKRAGLVRRTLSLLEKVTSA